ncbi:oligosaccharyl transferase subunit ost3/OST6 [Leucoagaricus gongylophorus]
MRRHCESQIPISFSRHTHMHVLAVVVAVVVAIVAVAASPHDTLLDLAQKGHGLIRLDAHSYDLLTTPKRTWSASVQLTALDPRRKCAPCKQFAPAWDAMVNAWSNAEPDHRNNHFFATLDFDDAPAVFQKLGLSSAPVVLAFSPDHRDPHKYDFSEGFDAGPLAEFLSRYSPVPIPYREPIDTTRIALTSILALSLLLSFRFAAPILQYRWTWAMVIVLTSLIMISGYMFTKIRGMPYVAPGGWIAPGFQSQYGQEVHVVAFIYGLLSFAFLMLLLVVPTQTSPTRQRAQVYLWSAIIVIVYSLLLSLFRVKNRGYPFKLFF